MEDRTITLHIKGVPAPDTVHGVATVMKDETQAGEGFLILINENDNEQLQLLSFIHEMLHIWHKDIEEPGADIAQLEKKRHEELKTLLQLL